MGCATPDQPRFVEWHCQHRKPVNRLKLAISRRSLWNDQWRNAMHHIAPQQRPRGLTLAASETGKPLSPQTGRSDGALKSRAHSAHKYPPRPVEFRGSVRTIDRTRQRKQRSTGIEACAKYSRWRWRSAHERDGGLSIERQDHF